MTKKELLALAKKHGTPVVVIDHDVIRRNYATFRKHLPKVQAYYAVKANPAPEIVRTLYKAGASFDVASMPEFLLVHENIERLPAKARQDFIWDKIIYANPDQAQGNIAGARPVQAADHIRQHRGAAQDQALRAACRAGVAPARSQHRVDGGAVV
jgi:diaminopimelate decarboxylase